VTGSIVDHHAQLSHSSVNGRFRVETSSHALVSTHCDIQSERL